MRRPEFAIIFLVVLLALVSGAWLARATLVEFAVVKVLRNAGLQDISAEFQQLDLDHTQVSKLGFSLVNASGLLVFESNDVAIDYSISQLVNGRIDTLTINTIEVHYTPAEPQTDTPANTPVLQPAEVIAAIRHGLQEYGFANQIRVNTIVLHGTPFGALHNIPFELNISQDGDRIMATATRVQPGSPPADNNLQQLVITQLTADSLAADLRYSSTPGPSPAAIKIDFSQSDNQQTKLAGSYQIDPQRLQYWLDPASKPQDIDTANTIKGTFNVDFKSANEIISSLTASTGHLSIDGVAVDNADIRLITRYSNTGSVQQLSLDDSSYLRLDKLQYDTVSIAPGKIQLAGQLTGLRATSANDWNIHGTVSTSTISLNLPSQVIALKDISARVKLNADNISLNGSFAPARLPANFSFVVEHNLTSGRGKLLVDPSTPISLDANTHKLSQLVSPWTYPFDLLAGSLQLSSRANWSQNQKFNLTTKIKLDNAGGSIGELLFSGLAFDHELEILPALRSLKPTQLDLMHIDSGVTASNISALLQLRTVKNKPLPEIGIQKLQGDIFGGKFSADDFNYDLNAATNRLKINASNIDLAKIVETQQLEDITVTGRIDGSIPVIINAQGVSIEHGAFINDVRAGTIRYNPTAGTEQLKQNPITGITLDALRDFRYSELSAGVDFTPEGILTIDLKLKGTSPALDSKRPVHLNINTEQNLLSLLKSLRYARGVSDRIDAKVRRQYEKNKQ